MDEKKVTIIVPVYNVEKYLDRCLTSIVNQTYKNLEILLIDDGSPDNCPIICDEWAKKDNRIRVIHKKNAGLGMARNTGIDNATGEYICFFDSDDYVELDVIEKCYIKAIQFNSDIVTYGFCSVSSNGEVVKKHIPNVKKEFFEGEEIQSYILPNMIAPNMLTGEITNLWMSMCGALFSMKMIKSLNWRLVSERDIISEDLYSLLCLYKGIKRVVVIPEAYYYYCENVVSLTHTYREDRFIKIKYFYNECLKVCKEANYSKEIENQLAYPFVSNIIGTLKIIVLSNLKNIEKKKKIKEILSDAFLQKILKGMNIEKESINRKIFIKVIRAKCYFLCYFMLKIKS